MTDYRFPKRLRLLSSRDFERVFAGRQSVSDQWLVLYGATNELGNARIGLTVSRKLGGATVRNRWKRLLREVFRLKQHELPAIDFVCVPRAAEAPTFQELLESLPALANRLQHKMEQRKRVAEA
jgi:ribonuclease P protein component